MNLTRLRGEVLLVQELVQVGGGCGAVFVVAPIFVIPAGNLRFVAAMVYAISELL